DRFAWAVTGTVIVKERLGKNEGMAQPATGFFIGSVQPSQPTLFGIQGLKNAPRESLFGVPSPTVSRTVRRT
ncbi:MAG TPA: hypothetical protein PKW66_25545, partial [Polyangiaceae bacterium]|nr:hypothetical protein [Polyangiaceae bacterium]